MLYDPDFRIVPHRSPLSLVFARGRFFHYERDETDAEPDPICGEWI